MNMPTQQKTENQLQSLLRITNTANEVQARAALEKVYEWFLRRELTQPSPEKYIKKREDILEDMDLWAEHKHLHFLLTKLFMIKVQVEKKPDPKTKVLHPEIYYIGKEAIINSVLGTIDQFIYDIFYDLFVVYQKKTGCPQTAQAGFYDKLVAGITEQLQKRKDVVEKDIKKILPTDDQKLAAFVKQVTVTATP